jgi:hypothetical protein
MPLGLPKLHGGRPLTTGINLPSGSRVLELGRQGEEAGGRQGCCGVKGAPRETAAGPTASEHAHCRPKLAGRANPGRPPRAVQEAHRAARVAGVDGKQGGGEPALLGPGGAGACGGVWQVGSRAGGSPLERSLPAGCAPRCAGPALPAATPTIPCTAPAGPPPPGAPPEEGQVQREREPEAGDRVEGFPQDAQVAQGWGGGAGRKEGGYGRGWVRPEQQGVGEAWKAQGGGWDESGARQRGRWAPDVGRARRSPHHVSSTVILPSLLLWRRGREVQSIVTTWFPGRALRSRAPP